MLNTFKSQKQKRISTLWNAETKNDTIRQHQQKITFV